MVNYDTIPEEAQVQPAAKTAWRRVVVVAAAASFVLGAFALRTATPTVALDAEVKLGPVKHEVVPVASALDYTGPDYSATDGPPVPSFADDQDEDEPEDQSEDQDADADEPEDQDEHED